ARPPARGSPRLSRDRYQPIGNSQRRAAARPDHARADHAAPPQPDPTVAGVGDGRADTKTGQDRIERRVSGEDRGVCEVAGHSRTERTCARPRFAIVSHPLNFAPTKMTGPAPVIPSAARNLLAPRGARK